MAGNMIRMILKSLRGYLKTAGQRLIGPSGMIDLSNLFEPGIEDIMNETHYDKGFKACRSNDEYNKEVVNYLKCHHDYVYLDQTTKDGHFRV